MEGSLFATIKKQYENLEAENKQLKLQLEAEQNSQERTRKDHLKQINNHLEEIMDLKNEVKVTREVEINGLCGYKTQIDDLKKEIKHKDNKFAEWCGENKQLKEENKQLKGYINSLMTEEQKDICNGEAMEFGEPTLQTPKDWIERLREFLEERDELAEKVEDLEEQEDEDWLSVFSVLSDAGYAPTSRGQVVSSIKDLKEELEAEKFYSKQLKDCNYEEYCELVGENKLIKEFEDLKNELGELK